MATDSLNAPVPGLVRRLAADLAPRLAAFETVRDRHTLVCKRFERSPDPAALRDVLHPVDPFEVTVAGVDHFADPPTGPAPVVYLAVESPGLVRLHRRLVDAFGAVAGLEGEAYVPHVTLARGGSVEAAERVATDADLDPVTWRVDRLDHYDAEYGEAVRTTRL